MDRKKEHTLELDRLYRLRELLKHVPEELLKMDQPIQETTYGTAHCAAGWAASEPEFNHQGLRWASAEEQGHWLVFKTAGDPVYDFEACEAFFGLTQAQSSNLFGYKLLKGDVVPKEEVVSNVDRLLSGMVTRPYVRPEPHQVWL